MDRRSGRAERGYGKAFRTVSPTASFSFVEDSWCVPVPGCSRMVAVLALTLAATAYRGPLPARLAAQCRTRACSPLLVETENKKGSQPLVENAACMAGLIGRGWPGARCRPGLPSGAGEACSAPAEAWWALSSSGSAAARAGQPLALGLFALGPDRSGRPLPQYTVTPTPPPAIVQAASASRSSRATSPRTSNPSRSCRRCALTLTLTLTLP